MNARLRNLPSLSDLWGQDGGRRRRSQGLPLEGQRQGREGTRPWQGPEAGGSRPGRWPASDHQPDAHDEAELSELEHGAEPQGHGAEDEGLTPDDLQHTDTVAGRALERPVIDLGGRTDGVSPDPASPGSWTWVPLDQTFLLESNPGASKTIFLDFDGASLLGTAWNSSNLANGWAPAFSLDADGTTLSAAELQTIQEIFFRVAADYAPFDVNVTLKAPAAAQLTRSSTSDQQYGTVALFSNISSQVGYGSSGGVAYVGVFDYVGDNYKPALIFPDKLGNGAKAIAEAASHELGHNLGLSHDGTATTGYYSGQGTAPGWAPIMGVGYYKSLTQFSMGEYAGANNTENDFSKIAGEGVNYFVDTEADTAASARLLTFNLDRNSDGRMDAASMVGSIDLKSSSGLGASGIWPDVDVYSFYLPAYGDLTIHVANGLAYNIGSTQVFDYLPTGWGNLRLDALLYAGDGTTLLGDWNNNAALDVTNFSFKGLGAGTYYLGVRANPNSPDGETVWGSLGQYQVNLDYSASGPVVPQSASYSLTPSASTVNEGTSVRFDLLTSGVPQSTTLNWQISGITSDDLETPGLLSGSLVVDANGRASFTLNLKADQLTELTPESITATLLDPISGQPLATAAPVLVNDTSQTPVVSMVTKIWGTTGSDSLGGTTGVDQITGVLATGTSASAMGRGQIDLVTGDAGADLFVLADSRGTFYNDGSSRSSGTADYLRIQDFSVAEDRLQLRRGSQYLVRNVAVAGGMGTEIYLGNGDSSFNSRDELIARIDNVALAPGTAVSVIGSVSWISLV